MMPINKKAPFVADESAVEPEPVEKVVLLTVEGHPILGRIERWRMSDGTVQAFKFTSTFVEQPE